MKIDKKNIQIPESKAQIMNGTVVKISGDKTIAVEVLSSFQHPVYKKKINRTKKYLVHDPRNEAKIGDSVVIKAVKPLSSKKRWMLQVANKKESK